MTITFTVAAWSAEAAVASSESTVSTSEPSVSTSESTVSSSESSVSTTESTVSLSESTFASENYRVPSKKHKIPSRKHKFTPLELSNMIKQRCITTDKSTVDSKPMLEHKSTSTSTISGRDINKATSHLSKLSSQKYTIPSPLAVSLIPTLFHSNKMSVRTYSTESDGDPVMTHLDRHGKARMVDVGDKPVTSRAAEAQCCLRVGGRLLRLLRDARLPKGDALTVAQIAGVVGAKKTADLIPMCHPLPLDCVRINIELPTAECDDGGDIKVHCEVRVTSKTGAEMEALTGASVAALALYDMCKSVDKHMKITDLKVIRKSGGRSGNWPKENVPEDVKIRDYNKSPIKPKETYVPTNMMYF